MLVLQDLSLTPSNSTPHYSASTLSSWYNSHVPEHASRLLRYFADRTTMVAELVDVAEIVTKNA